MFLKGGVSTVSDRPSSDRTSSGRSRSYRSADAPPDAKTLEAEAKLAEHMREQRGHVPSIISEDLIIDGNITSDGEVQIDGRILGDVRAETLTIGEMAAIEGSVRAVNVRVAGIVKGEVHGDNVYLAKSAKVIGDIVHQTLCIEAGAYLDGNCRRITDDVHDRPQPTAPRAMQVTGTVARPAHEDDDE